MPKRPPKKYENILTSAQLINQLFNQFKIPNDTAQRLIAKMLTPKTDFDTATWNLKLDKDNPLSIIIERCYTRKSFEIEITQARVLDKTTKEMVSQPDAIVKEILHERGGYKFSGTNETGHELPPSSSGYRK